MKNKAFHKILPVFAFLFVILGCTDLDEDILDESLTGTGEAEVISG